MAITLRNQVAAMKIRVQKQEECILRLRARVASLEEALRKIASIELQEFGGDWDEIEEAQDIARRELENESRYAALRDAEKTISDCLQEIAFRSGVNAGWNAALLPTDLEACAKKAELLADPCNRLATLKAARAEVDRILS